MAIPSPRKSTVKTILLVEDEPMLRASMARGLGRLPDVEVVEAGSVREALRMLDTFEPAMLLSDLDLPDGSGLEVAGALDKRKLRVPIVFVSAFVGRYRAQLARHSEVEIHEKPVPLERLRDIVAKSLEPREVEVPPFGVPDYVQLAAMGRRSVVLEVRGASVRGQIVIEKGEALSAIDNRGEGLEAFRRLAFLKAATVQCRAIGPGERFTRNIEGSCESLLLDAARMADEASAAGAEEGVDLAWDEAPSPADPTSRTMVRPHEAERFGELYDEGIEALLKKDYARAFDAFLGASELRADDASVRANLTRLREMGYGR